MSTYEFDIRSIRLLLVEDNPADARVVERHLKDAGLNQVISDWVQTASEAAQRLQTEEYDLVLLDLGLPDARGLQALRALRAVADLTPIIVLTGSDDYKQGLIAVREGAQDYLEKRRVNAGMLSRIVSYSVERNNFTATWCAPRAAIRTCSTTCPWRCSPPITTACSRPPTPPA